MPSPETIEEKNPSTKELKLKEYRVICFLPTTIEFSAVEEFRKKMISLVENDLNGYVRKAAKFKQHMVKTTKNKGNRSIQVVLLQVFLKPQQTKEIEKHLLLLRESISNFMILKESDFLSEEEIIQRKEREQNRREMSRDRNRDGQNRNH